MPPEDPPIPDARPLVDRLLTDALARGVSDIHIEPSADACEIRFRIDGILETHERLDAASGRAVVVRLMVMSHLLTYRIDVPQEGRLNLPGQSSEARISVMPTIHGLRAAVRLPAEQLVPATLGELGLPPPLVEKLKEFAAGDAGMLILTGPAGSGKTTTIYAILRQILGRGAAGGGISIVTLEDPVERDLPGVTQIEVSPFGQLTYEKALRSILRQDPQVLVIGEIRDAATATLAVQAALSGHRLITTLHAATGGGAVARLLEMGIEPYQITSSVWGVVAQRLVRKKNIEKSGYCRRVPLAELVIMDAALRKAVLERTDADGLRKVYEKQSAFRSLADCGKDLVDAGVTDEAELRRVLGAEIK